MKNLFYIGEVSKIKGITIKALRYYHKVGILVPRYIDQSSGYRYYSIDQFIYIDIIKGCRALGTSIEELQQIFKECDSEKLVDFLQVKRKEAEENIKKMKEIIKDIDILNANVQYSRDTLKSDEVSIKHFEDRHVIVSPCKETGKLKELLYYSELEKVLQEKNVEPTIERGIIYDLNLDGSISPKYVFNGFEHKDNMINDESVYTLPSGEYLTLAYTNENKHTRIEKIVKYVKRNNTRFKNFIELELLNDFFDTESYSCQIQMLIDDNDE